MDLLKNAYDSVAEKVGSLSGTELEKKVKEATSNENWGSSGSLKQEIADATRDYQNMREIFDTLWKRVSDKNNANWRIIFKSLDLVMFLLKFGHPRVIDEIGDRTSMIRGLLYFKYIDPESGRDKGDGIRETSKQLLDLVNDRSRLEFMRNEAQKQKTKLQSINQTGIGSDNGGGSFGQNNSYNNQSYKSRDDDTWRTSNYNDNNKSLNSDDNESDRKKKKKTKKI